ncbi:MAG: hypothetical protein GX053_02300, partial [Tissierella sp.]|nr:hypothetical protein [Tissierella sp.]
MAIKTENLGLNKPVIDDKIEITINQHLPENFDILDEEVSKKLNKLDKANQTEAL